MFTCLHVDDRSDTTKSYINHRANAYLQFPLMNNPEHSINHCCGLQLIFEVITILFFSVATMVVEIIYSLCYNI